MPLVQGPTSWMEPISTDILAEMQENAPVRVIGILLNCCVLSTDFHLNRSLESVPLLHKLLYPLVHGGYVDTWWLVPLIYWLKNAKMHKLRVTGRLPALLWNIENIKESALNKRLLRNSTIYWEKTQINRVEKTTDIECQPQIQQFDGSNHEDWLRDEPV